MNDIKYSPFLQYVLEKAGEAAAARGDSLFSVEDVFSLIVLNTVRAKDGEVSKETFVGTEFDSLNFLVNAMGHNIKGRVKAMVVAVSNRKTDSFNNAVQVDTLFRRASKIAEEKGKDMITADIIIECILEKKTDLVEAFLSGDILKYVNTGESVPAEPVSVDSSSQQNNGSDAVYWFGKQPEEAQPVTGENPVSAVASAPAEDTTDPKGKLATELEKLKDVRKKLLSVVFGQDHAVNNVIQGLFKAVVSDMTDKKRRRPLATFLFAGPPGVGKTFIAEKMGEFMGYNREDIKRFDMSDYSDEDSMVALFGSDGVYKDSQPGRLTQFVTEHPKSILIFDEIEKAHLVIIHQFLQILDAGHCQDQKTRKDVSFKDTVIIFTTNAGRPLYEGTEQNNFSGVSSKVVLGAIKKDINPLTKEPYFPTAICSRFATGNVVMFNHITASDLIRLAKNNVEEHVSAVEEKFGYKVEIDERVYAAILYSEGGLADARSVSSRSKLFFDNEFYELLRLIQTDDVTTSMADIESINIRVQLPKDKEDIVTLFEPQKDVEILVFGDETTAEEIKTAAKGFTVHTASDYDTAFSLIKERGVRAVLCDLHFGLCGDCDYLNVEDMESDSRTLFRYVTKCTDIPVYVIQKATDAINPEEIVSLNKEGAMGVVNEFGRDEELSARMVAISNQIHYQHSLNELARANKLVSFSTAQAISDDGKSAEITLFDFTMDVAVDAEDQDSIMGKMSKPDVKFCNVRGCEDAKRELQFFIDYMKNPRKYAGTGVAAPKGILLYGPPGTGKTLLAKATAGESDVTFISEEGNNFISGGKEAVHELFRVARKYAPSIVFIDEIDAIAKERTGHNPGLDSILTAFLTEMDGFKTNPAKPVFVLAATNFEVEEGSAKSLDQALMRRFDRRIYIGLPSKESREEHLRVKIANNPLFEISDNTIMNIVIRSMGKSLANLDSILNLAIRTALRDGKRKVTDKILDEAFETFNSGDARERTKEEILRTARHEAGHALLYYHSGDVPSYITIVSRGDYGGYMMPGEKAEKGPRTKPEILAHIRTSLAGRAAEILYYGENDGVSVGPSSDLRKATYYAKHMICSWGMSDEFGLSVIDTDHLDMACLADDVKEVVNRILKTELEATIRILTENKDKLDALVDALVEKNQLAEAEIRAILET